MLEESAKLAQYVESHSEDGDRGRRPEKLAVTQLLTFLGQSFSSLVDLALTTLIQVCYHFPFLLRYNDVLLNMYNAST